jgi:hypothetical protein
METSVDSLTAIETLALKHELRREAIVCELERRRGRRARQTVIGGGSTDQWWNSRTWRRTHRCIITTNDRAIAMTSERQIDANRRNAMKSTGPTAAKGKRRSSRSALRHGLSRPRWLEAQESAIAAKIAEFTQKLVGEDASPTEIALARAAAEAQFDLRRVRQHREALLAFLLREVAAGTSRSICAGIASPAGASSDGIYQTGLASSPYSRNGRIARMTILFVGVRHG